MVRLSSVGLHAQHQSMTVHVTTLSGTHHGFPLVIATLTPIYSNVSVPILYRHIRLRHR
jgi:hypothetical protein